METMISFRFLSLKFSASIRGEKIQLYQMEQIHKEMFTLMTEEAQCSQIFSGRIFFSQSASFDNFKIKNNILILLLTASAKMTQSMALASFKQPSVYPQQQIFVKQDDVTQCVLTKIGNLLLSQMTPQYLTCLHLLQIYCSMTFLTMGGVDLINKQYMEHFSCRSLC